jgi:hypothetical protein
LSSRLPRQGRSKRYGEFARLAELDVSGGWRTIDGLTGDEMKAALAALAEGKKSGLAALTKPQWLLVLGVGALAWFRKHLEAAETTKVPCSVEGFPR